MCGIQCLICLFFLVAKIFWTNYSVFSVLAICGLADIVIMKLSSNWLIKTRLCFILIAAEYFVREKKCYHNMRREHIVCFIKIKAWALLPVCVFSNHEAPVVNFTKIKPSNITWAEHFQGRWIGQSISIQTEL